MTIFIQVMLFILWFISKYEQICDVPMAVVWNLCLFHFLILVCLYTSGTACMHGFVPLCVNKAYRYSCQLAVLVQAQGQMLKYPPWLAVSIYLHLSICLPLPLSSSLYLHLPLPSSLYASGHLLKCHSSSVAAISKVILNNWKVFDGGCYVLKGQYCVFLRHIVQFYTKVM